MISDTSFTRHLGILHKKRATNAGAPPRSSLEKVHWTFYGRSAASLGSARPIGVANKKRRLMPAFFAPPLGLEPRTL